MSTETAPATDQPLVRVEFAESLDTPTLEEVAQMLGYDFRDVSRIEIEPRRVTVTTVHVAAPADLVDVVHVHTVL